MARTPPDPSILYTWRMLSRLAVVGILMSLVVMGCGPSGSRKVLLRLKASPGDSYAIEYTTSTTLNRAGTAEAPPLEENSTLTILRRLTCEEAKDGVTTWNLKTESAKADGSGTLAMQSEQAAQAELKKNLTLKRDERNQIVDEPKTSPLEFEFPIQEVQVGNSWRSEAQIQGVPLQMVFTVDGFETVDGKEAVIISGRLEDGRNVRMTRPPKAWFDVENGWPLKGECAFEVDVGDATKVKLFIGMVRK